MSVKVQSTAKHSSASHAMLNHTAGSSALSCVLLQLIYSWF